MKYNEHIIEKISEYFKKISEDSHNKVFGNDSWEYISTSPNHIYETLNTIKELESDISDKKFLDVGSGIGNICCVADLMGFDVEGIEFNPVLFEISKQIYPDIKINNVDIRNFNNYNDFDIIFYCLPFKNEELQLELKEKIENCVKVGTYIITRGKEIKDDRFKKINDKYKYCYCWLKIKE